MSKESVSKSYMQRQKDAHAAKPMKEFRCATVIGSNKKDNIGAAIARKLDCGT